MSTKIIPVPISGIMALRVTNQPLWHTIEITPQPDGNYSGKQSFFTASNFGQETNVINGCLPYPQHFDINKISLSMSADSNPTDFYTLISSSIGEIQVGAGYKLNGPAEMFCRGNTKEFNQIVKSLKKLPKLTQISLLQNLKIANGFVLPHSIELLPQQCFRFDLQTTTLIKLKKPIKLTCMLEGLNKRPVY